MIEETNCIKPSWCLSKTHLNFLA